MRRLAAGLMVTLAVGSFSATGATDPLERCSYSIDHGETLPAIVCLQPFADAGDAWAEMDLGTEYGIVNRPTYDAAKSAHWTKKAAEHGNTYAQLQLVYLYRHGEGLPKDLQESLRWFRAAADRGDQAAEYELGSMYSKGLGTPRDVGQALTWERKAADQEGPWARVAEESIGGIYLKGEGAPQNYTEAVRWLRKAAEHGSPTAYLTLAQVDESGLAGPPDLVEAYVGYSIVLAWLQTTHAAGNIIDAVDKRRGDVEAKLTPAQKARADDVVRQNQETVH